MLPPPQGFILVAVVLGLLFFGTLAVEVIWKAVRSERFDKPLP
jgi:hypothetical protein